VPLHRTGGPEERHARFYFVELVRNVFRRKTNAKREKNTSGMDASSFSIHDSCSGLAESEARPECVLSDGVVVPSGLKVRDGERVYVVDTGSTDAVLAHDDCDGAPLAPGEGVHVHYGSEVATNKALASDARLLGSTVRPWCNIGGLSPNHGDGLVGVAPRLSGAPPYGKGGLGSSVVADEHAIMNVRTGAHRLVVDKAARTVCLGGDCPAPSGNVLEEAPLRPVNKFAMMAAVTRDDSERTFVFDTGSTDSIGLGAHMCIVGNKDIRALDVDYDAGTVRYDVDVVEASRRCAAHNLVPPTTHHISAKAAHTSPPAADADEERGEGVESDRFCAIPANTFGVIPALFPTGRTYTHDEVCDTSIYDTPHTTTDCGWFRGFLYSPREVSDICASR
jgi:hypothetical protein